MFTSVRGREGGGTEQRCWSCFPAWAECSVHATAHSRPACIWQHAAGARGLTPHQQPSPRCRELCRPAKRLHCLPRPFPAPMPAPGHLQSRPPTRHDAVHLHDPGELDGKGGARGDAKHVAGLGRQLRLGEPRRDELLGGGLVVCKERARAGPGGAGREQWETAAQKWRFECTSQAASCPASLPSGADTAWRRARLAPWAARTHSKGSRQLQAALTASAG